MNFWKAQVQRDIFSPVKSLLYSRRLTLCHHEASAPIHVPAYANIYIIFHLGSFFSLKQNWLVIKIYFDTHANWIVHELFIK